MADDNKPFSSQPSGGPDPSTAERVAPRHEPDAPRAVPAAAAAPAPTPRRGFWAWWHAAKSDPQHPPQADSVREVVETVVFVVVLVLLLKSFVAEAFVIPTGSMAETLWGYQKVVKCPQCDYQFPVNCSQQVDPQEGQRPAPVVGCTCPNCL